METPHYPEISHVLDVFYYHAVCGVARVFRRSAAYILVAAASAARMTSAPAGVPFSFSNSPYGVP